MGKLINATNFDFIRIKLKTVAMFHFRIQILFLIIVCGSNLVVGQNISKNGTSEYIIQRKLDSLLLISNIKNQTIEKLKADNTHLQAEIDASKIRQSNSKVKGNDCTDKLAEQEDIVRRQRSDIEQLYQKIKVLEAQLGKVPVKEQQVEEVVKSSIHTVKIGSQTWMTTNLNVTTFRNGDPIYEAQSVEEWERCGKKKIPAWCWYDNDPKTDKKTGKLYNWYAVNDPRGLTPVGYHVPSESDWNTLVNHLGGELDAAPKMRLGKEWGDSTTVVHSKTNFAAVPSGWRLTSPEGTAFTSEGAYWWSASPLSLKFAWTRYVVFFSREVKSYCYPKSSGLAVRCIKD